MVTSHDNDCMSWSEPAETASADSLHQQFLKEHSESAGLSSVDFSDQLDRRPIDATSDQDIAGARFEDFRYRSLRGEPISRTNSELETPEERDSMASLFRRRDLLCSITLVCEPSVPAFALPKIGDEFLGDRL